MVKEDEKLIIEDGVTVLEPLSFVDCKAKEIIMPDSVETIKHCAFKIISGNSRLFNFRDESA